MFFFVHFSDGDDSSFKCTKQVFAELNLTKYTDEDCRIVQYVCSLVSTRAAYLASAGKELDNDEIVYSINCSFVFTQFHLKLTDLL